MKMNRTFRWLNTALLILGATAAQADERESFLRQQYLERCLAFADDPDGYRRALVASALPRLPDSLVSGLLDASRPASAWSLAFNGRRDYVLVLAEDEHRCAILALYADAERTRRWFAQLMEAPPPGYRPAAPPRPDEPALQQWVWQGAQHSLVLALRLPDERDARVQAELNLKLIANHSP